MTRVPRAMECRREISISSSPSPSREVEGRLARLGRFAGRCCTPIVNHKMLRARYEIVRAPPTIFHSVTGVELPGGECLLTLVKGHPGANCWAPSCVSGAAVGK